MVRHTILRACPLEVERSENFFCASEVLTTSVPFFLNGVNCVNHTGGHLPFQVDISHLLLYSKLNLLSVAVNNTLTPETIPQGEVIYPSDKESDRYPDGFFKVELNFDFFNYAGIHRSVQLYSVPSLHVTDLTVVTGVINNNTGVIDYSLLYVNETSEKHGGDISCHVEVYDQTDKLVARQVDCSGTVEIADAKLWWPSNMHPHPGYLYQFRAILFIGSQVVDVYEERVGIRTIQLTPEAFLINNRPFYFVGFGKHEDADVNT